MLWITLLADTRHPQAHIDDWLCDRLMGDLELLTPLMIATRFPAEAARLAADGLYTYQPPGGKTFKDITA